MRFKVFLLTGGLLWGLHGCRYLPQEPGLPPIQWEPVASFSVEDEVRLLNDGQHGLSFLYRRQPNVIFRLPEITEVVWDLDPFEVRDVAVWRDTLFVLTPALLLQGVSGEPLVTLRYGFFHDKIAAYRGDTLVAYDSLPRQVVLIDLAGENDHPLFAPVEPIQGLEVAPDRLWILDRSGVIYDTTGAVLYDLRDQGEDFTFYRTGEEVLFVDRDLGPYVFYRDLRTGAEDTLRVLAGPVVFSPSFDGQVLWFFAFQESVAPSKFYLFRYTGPLP